MQLYRNVHFYSNVTHTGLLKVHGCVNLKHTTQIRWKEKTFKVRLRFMFHYCIFVERRLPLAASLRGVCDPESAAFGCNKSTKKDEQGRPSTIAPPPIRGSALFVAIRPLSWLFAFTLKESGLCACNPIYDSGILLLQCAFHNMNALPNWSRWLKH
jgi:hypothetical protein